MPGLHKMLGNEPLQQSVGPRTNDIERRSVVTLIRYWGSDSSDLHKLIQSIVQSLQDTSSVIIGLNIDDDKTEAISKLSQNLAANPSLRLIPISPWGSVTHALNVLVHHALKLFPSVPFLLFRSCEISIAPHVVHTLASVLQQHPYALVAGAALPGHQVPSSILHSQQRTVNVPLNGDTVPWNTLALWRVEALRLTGFPMTADLLSPSGMEEVAVLALHHQLFCPTDGETLPQALLIVFHSSTSTVRASSVKAAIEWQCRFNSLQRTEKHCLKMRSKNERSDRILKLLHVQSDTMNVCIINKIYT